MPSLSRRTLTQILPQLVMLHMKGVQVGHLIEAVNAALKTRRSVKLAHARVAKKKATKKDETRRIRDFVFARAGGLCEVRCGRMATDLEHAFGRVRVKQSTSNTLALCRECHREKTNAPHPEPWLRRYREIFLARGNTAEARLCEARLDSLELQGRVSPSLEENR